MKMVKTLLILGVVVYCAVMAGMFLFQRSLQYHPANKGLTPQSVGISGASVEHLPTPDGESLILWHAPAPHGRPTILYLHGNAGEIGDRPNRFRHYQAAGFGVAYLSYRGFGGSTGTISERGLITDAVTAYDWLLAAGVAPDSLALVGESLGTGVAVQLAAGHPVGAVALEAPYTSTADIAARTYWWLPVRLLMRDQFRSIAHIGRIAAPLLIIHGDADTLIPIAYGKRLFDAANPPKEMIVVPGKGHDALFEPATWAAETAFLDRVLAR